MPAIIRQIADSVKRFQASRATMLIERPLMPLMTLKKTASGSASAADRLEGSRVAY
jgi:hypothetical protein